jgi:hypothetical protein
MWHADQDKRPMILAIFGTILALIICSALWMHWHAPTEPQQVDSYRTEGNAGPVTGAAQRSQPAVGDQPGAGQ